MTLSSVASHVEDPVLRDRLRHAVDNLDAALEEIRAAVRPVTGDESTPGDATGGD